MTVPEVDERSAGPVLRRYEPADAVATWSVLHAAAWTLVTLDGERVVGFADLTDDGELDMFFVHPDHGRRGIATRLVAAVVIEAGRRGLSRVEVRASRVLQPLLERLGFVLDQVVLVNRVGDQVLANARLHLDLRP